MIIGGCDQLAVNGTGGLGLRAQELMRPDLAPAGPGYITITFGSGSSAPAPPFFISVTAAYGVLMVSLGCTEIVDGFELALTAAAYPPVDGSAVLFSPSGNFSTAASSGNQYIHARTTRDGVRSAWVSYNGSTVGQDDWTVVYTDDPLTGTNYAEYPNCAEITGWPMRYADEWTLKVIKAWATVYENGPTVGVLTGTGVRVTRHGAYVKMKIHCQTGSGYTTEGTGAAFGLRSAAVVAGGFSTESFYVMFWVVMDGDQFGDSDQRIVLGKFVNGTYSEIARSGNLYPTFMPVGDVDKDFVFRVVGNTFSCEIEGVKAWEYSNSDIPAADDRDYVGIYQNMVFGEVYRLAGYLKVGTKIVGGAAALNPGSTGDPLKEGTLAANFPLSHLARWACANAAKDCLHLRYTDAGVLVVEAYAEDGTRRATLDKTVSVDGHEHDAGDVTSGTLPVARGGLGSGSFTDGEFLKYDQAQGKMVSGAPTVSMALDDLVDVSAASPSIDDKLSWNGSAWVPAASTGGGGAGVLEAQIFS